MKERLPSAKFKLSTRWSGAERFTLLLFEPTRPGTISPSSEGEQRFHKLGNHPS
jgi:hypothetical protein